MSLCIQGLHRPAGGRMCSAPWGRVGAVRVASAPSKKDRTNV